MTRSQVLLLGLFVFGVLRVCLGIFLTSLLAMWALQSLAMLFGESYDWAGVLWQIYISLCLLAFYPGQSLWTYQIRTRGGVVITIAGDENRPWPGAPP